MKRDGATEERRLKPITYHSEQFGFVGFAVAERIRYADAFSRKLYQIGLDDNVWSGRCKNPGRKS